MVGKLKELLGSVKADKWLHFICGLIVAQLMLAVFSICMPYWASVLLSLFATACIGGAKELLDKVAGGVPSWADFWFTLAGAAIGLLIASLYLI